MSRVPALVVTVIARVSGTPRTETVTGAEPALGSGLIELMNSTYVPSVPELVNELVRFAI